MGSICPPFFGDKSKDEIKAELEKVNKDIELIEEKFGKLRADKSELEAALAD